jgi:protein TonB
MIVRQGDLIVAGLRASVLGTQRTVCSVLIAGALLALAGCGDDSASSAAPKVAAKAAAPASAPATPAPAGSAEQAVTPIPSDANTVTVTARTEKTSDVMKWLSLLPDKAAKPTPPPAPAAAATAAAPTQTLVATAAPIQKAAPPPAPVVVAPPPAAPAPAPAPVAVVAPPPAVAETPKVVALHLLSREEPSYPKEALRQGIRAGHVRVRIQVGTDGTVAKADVVESSPRQVFDRSVLAAVKGWKYSPISEPTTTTVDIEFNLD